MEWHGSWWWQDDQGYWHKYGNYQAEQSWGEDWYDNASRSWFLGAARTDACFRRQRQVSGHSAEVRLKESPYSMLGITERR